MKDIKIFCIGYNKTGTTSLFYAIQSLGFKGDDEIFTEGELLMKNVKEGDLKSVTDWVKEKNNIELFKDVPFSIPHVWKSLYQKYPDAIYVLSERDSSEQWYNSIYKFHKLGFGLSDNPSWDEVYKIPYNRRYLKESGSCSFVFDYMAYTYGIKGLPYDKDNLINSYEAHNKEIKEFFKDKDNFISINVSNNNDYLRLCSFLNKEPKGNVFPRTKITSDKTTW